MDSNESMKSTISDLVAYFLRRWQAEGRFELHGVVHDEQDGSFWFELTDRQTRAISRVSLLTPTPDTVGRTLDQKLRALLKVRHPLRDAKAKLDRSFEIYTEVTAQHDDVLRQFSLKVSEPREMTINGMRGVLIPVETQQPVAVPDRFGVLVGEVANSVRSSLDYIVGELALLDSGVRQERTMFPVYAAEKDFNDAAKAKRGPMAGLAAPRVEELRGLQPFNGVKWTANLVELSNTDKHRFLLATLPDIVVGGHFAPNATTGQLDGTITFQRALLVDPPGVPVLESLLEIGKEAHAFLVRHVDDFPGDFGDEA
jgi:hypothetical protein